eukprot:6182632-Pleurochrysis_carterae.AAC.1
MTHRGRNGHAGHPGGWRGSSGTAARQMGDRYSANLPARGGRWAASVQRGHGRRNRDGPRGPVRRLVTAGLLQGLTGEVGARGKLPCQSDD